MKRLPLLLLALGLTACASGPETKKKSPLSHLHGENYHSPASPPDNLVIPVTGRKTKASTIKGYAFFKSGLAEVPVKQLTLVLYRNDTAPVAEAQTSLDGEFTFHRALDDGRYTIKPVAGAYDGALAFILEGFEANELRLELVKKAAGKAK
ncbi:MAG TPA: hypothetical protein VFV50_02645 [Bdellovibrionales bacterium]|nr:hypothetical protein [Bdellovibrionales bacterium]